MPSRWRESTRVTEADVVLSKYGGMNPIDGAEFQPVTVGACVSTGFGARSPPF
jgi:hypothetical protein